MLHSIFPQVDHKFLSMPLLGPVADGFDDWLATNGYTCSSRKHAIQVLRHIDLDLRRRRISEIAKLTHAILDDCWRDRNKLFPGDAGTVRTLERYLITNSMIAVAETGGVPIGSAAAVLVNEYANYLSKWAGLRYLLSDTTDMSPGASWITSIRRKSLSGRFSPATWRHIFFRPASV